MSEAIRFHSSLEVLYHIGRELASDLDLHTLLLRVLMRSLDAVGANSGSIIVLDANGSPIDSAIVYSQKVYEHTNQQLRSTLESGLAGWVVRNRKIALVSDTGKDARWEIRPDDLPEHSGSKSAVGVPLMGRHELVGVMTLVHPVPGTFGPDHEDLIQAIADQAGIAILNARLYDESRRQLRVMSALAESAATLTASLGNRDILQRVLDQVQQALRVETVFLALGDPETGVLRLQAATGKAAESLVGIEIFAGKGAAQWVMETGQTVVVNDPGAETRFDLQGSEIPGTAIRALACSPIRHEGMVIGVLQAQNPLQGEFDPDAELVLQGIGGLAGSVIRHGQLFDSLKAAHQSFQDLFEENIDPILLTDWTGNISQVNRQAGEVSGFSRAELLACSVQELHRLPDEDPFVALRRRPVGRAFSYESVLETQAIGLPIQVYVRRILLDGEECLQWVFRDIHERKHLDTLRDDLLSMIYHDLRSPLANVVYSLDSLEAALPEDEVLNSILEIAMRATERMQQLTDSLLDIKAMEAGQPIIQPAPLDLRQVVGQAVKSAGLSVQRKNQILEVVIPDDPPPLVADPDLILRVCTNLLENAVKFTPSGGSIRIGAEREGEEFRIWVTDNGPGIPRLQRKAIFDKHARLDGKIGGLGLGLAFCRLVVEAHQGRIWVEDGTAGGSKFMFTLPLGGETNYEEHNARD